MDSIRFENVSKSFGKTKIINNLNLSIEKGERLILLGPSGCGKSTILRMISGLETITTGNLYLNGKLANDVDSGDRDIAMVFQNYALYPHMTIEENVGYGLRIHKEKKDVIRQRVKEAIDILNLTGLEGRYPKELSGGQRQRVALARAIVKRSDFFLLDEPLSNLDAQLRGQARKELVRIHEMYGQTFIYVPHDQIEAMTVGQRIALLNGGDLQMLDTPHNVYHRPANIFVAKFIGSPSMNITESTYMDGQRKIDGQRIELPDMWKEQAARQSSNRLYFGIRPEHVKLSTERLDNALAGTVKYVEDYGNRFGAYVDVGGVEFIAVGEEKMPPAGAKVYFRPDFERIHLFDYESQESIGYPSRLNKEHSCNSLKAPIE